MNVFDFDNTIYNGDSTVDFCLFCVKRHPALLRYLPYQGLAAFRYAIKKINKTAMKQHFYAFFRAVEDMEAEVEAFWETHEKNIHNWYLAVASPDDVVISASPEFLLRPICAKLGIGHLIASPVDPENGHYYGQNCFGKEKVARFREQFPNAEIDSFYSDSRSDEPLARLAHHSYLVCGDTLSEWNPSPTA